MMVNKRTFKNTDMSYDNIVKNIKLLTDLEERELRIYFNRSEFIELEKYIKQNSKKIHKMSFDKF